MCILRVTMVHLHHFGVRTRLGRPSILNSSHVRRIMFASFRILLQFSIGRGLTLGPSVGVLSCQQRPNLDCQAAGRFRDLLKVCGCLTLLDVVLAGCKQQQPCSAPENPALCPGAGCQYRRHLEETSACLPRRH